MVFDPSGCIIWALRNHPQTTNDLGMATYLREFMDANLPPGVAKYEYSLVGDAAFALSLPHALTQTNTL